MRLLYYKDLYDESHARSAIINDRMEGFKEDYLILHILLRKYNIKSCFEIGTHTGWGTKIIKNALGESGIVFSLDLPDSLSSVSKQHPLSEGKDGVGVECDLPFIQIRGDSRTFDYSLYPCEAYWIDAEHTYDNVFIETTNVLAQHPEIAIFHDTDDPQVFDAIVAAKTDEYELIRVVNTRISYLLNKTNERVPIKRAANN